MSAQFALGCKVSQAGDFAEAANWYRKAANKGHALAQMNLGAMCLKGKGIKKNYAEVARCVPCKSSLVINFRSTGR